MNFNRNHRLGLFVALLLILATVTGDLEPTFGRCCAYGANWARESQQCSAFPTVVAAIPTEHQSICITAAAICCLRYFRDEQCQKGKQAAQTGQDCAPSSRQGGEYFKDCCQGCKLGLFSNSMGMGCGSRFKFGFPWDNAFLQCCNQATPGNTGPNLSGSEVIGSDNLYPGLQSSPSVIPDIDECTDNSNTCDKDTQTCINSQGSFRCIDREPSCDFGFRYNEELLSCVDIDECEEGRDICDKVIEKCINNEGNYWCRLILDPSVPSNNPVTTTSTTTLKPPPLPSLPPKPDQFTPLCPLGTEYNRRAKACVDIDECIQDPCSTFEVCENSQGSYQCQCQVGYHREEADGDCQDMNECQMELHTCTGTQRCDNTIGSYACIRVAGCGTGYTLNHNTGECDDNDECKLNTHNCDQLGPKYQCFNIRGSFRCKFKTCSPLLVLSNEGICVDRSCDTGYKPGEFNCVDIDECTEGNPCRQNERCINTMGSYTCQPLLTCYVGYEMNEAGTQCIDIDECTKGTHQCEGNQLCSNRQGGYICHCPQGFRLNAQRQCEDVNECESYHGRACASNAECENTEGSFLCKCKEGFKQASNGKSCIDVDECEETPGICSHNCINVWGTYHCTCRAGHILDADNRTCSDVDECENFRGRGHLCIGLCVNIPGSFKCSCPDGYTLATDGRTCKDINECEAGNVCRGLDEQCVNTRGGYKCNTITCPNNYVRDSRHKNRCKRLTSYCPPDDEACRLKPLSYSYNYLPLVSNMTLSSLGQVDIFTMRGPLWASTTVQFELELEDTQTPPGVEPVTREYFQLRRTAFNQAVISLVKTIFGPQEIQLSLNMKLYQQGRFSGSAVAKLLVYVSEYTF